MALPKWAKYEVDSDGVNKIMVNPAVVYPKFVNELGLRMDQFGVEVVMRVITQLLLDAEGPGIRIKILPNDNFRLDRLPEGKGASNGRNGFYPYYLKVRDPNAEHLTDL